MKNIFKQSLIVIDKKYYLHLLIIMAPFLNFLSGINFDLHAPSLPAISAYFSSPVSAAKNTITMALFGFSIGCLVFGTLLDMYGRRPVIILGLFIYTIASFSALLCHTINELLGVRFLQGFSVSCVSIGCRTIIIDTFTGHQFKVALLYTSLAFGMGPIIAPFLGGYLQYHFGWEANFIAYGVISFVLLLMVVLFLDESKKTQSAFSIVSLLGHYLNVFRHELFLASIVITGLAQVQLLVYTTVGAFIVENVLNKTAIAYGNSALIISCGYLLGTIVNRFLIKEYATNFLVRLGFILLFISIGVMLIFSLTGHLTLLSLIVPITLIGFSNGFIFVNVLSSFLKSSPQAGIATALFTSSTIAIATIGNSIVSHINVTTLLNLVFIYGALGLIEVGMFTLKGRLYIDKTDQ